MPRFTFICEDEPMPFSVGVTTKRTVEFDAVHIDDVVSEFELFLRGAGFNYEGNIVIAQDDCELEEANTMIDDYHMSEREDAN